MIGYGAEFGERVAALRMCHVDGLRFGPVADINLDELAFADCRTCNEARQQRDPQTCNCRIAKHVAIVDTHRQLRTHDDCTRRGLEAPVRNAAIGVEQASMIIEIG